MFTSSPLYPPYLTPELLPRSINLDLNTYEGWTGVNASVQYQKLDYLQAEESELFPPTGRQTGRTFRSAARLASATSSGSRT
jgi:hypothetical protein